MSPIKEAVYFGSRNFCRQHPDMFVFSECDKSQQVIFLTIEYNGGFAIAKEAKSFNCPYVFGPRVQRAVDYEMITKYRGKGSEVIRTVLSEMYNEMTEKFELKMNGGII